MGDLHDLLLKNARIITEQEDYPGDILINNGKISSISNTGSSLKAKKVIDLENKPVLPGLIDSHVHLSEPGFKYREGFASGTKAAAAGGITLIADMPIANLPPVTSGEIMNNKAKLAEENLYIDLYLLGGITKDNLDILDQFPKAGSRVVKGFTIDQLKEFPCLLSGALFDGIKKASEAGLTTALHCEDNSIIEYRLEKVSNNDVDDFLWVFAEEAEILAVQNALYVAEKTNARLHILHASSAEVIDMVTAAKKRGVDVTVETALHYLLLTDEDVKEIGPAAKCTPPIRDRNNRKELWKRLLDGKIDLLGSDHSPSTVEEKFDSDNFFDAWGGIQSIQYTLQLLLYHGYHKRNLSLNQIVKLLAGGPSRLLQLPEERSSIRPGNEATFTILDLEKEWKITKENMLNKNKHSPYLGWEGKGLADMIMIRGKIIDYEKDNKYGKIIKSN